MDSHNAYAPPRAPVIDEVPHQGSSALRWWYGAPWRRYNAWMFTEGVIAYTALAWKALSGEGVHFRDLDLGLEFLLPGMHGGGLFMIKINLAFLLGPSVDLFIPRSLKDPYRRGAYRLGFWFSTVCIMTRTILWFMPA
jgi:hypothetical protein